ncbi:unnamed protein product [Didymodactylos carnosus]|uniref:RING-type domain-containing protein n=1 Tax=Didymodactylos carnosus TaxID=1234261 RepID=A0A815D2A3_9BILA|nr:unnamed protein product [Didymodactylos carnosus]CAF4109831.1 unnamed protein product [Didymodactylos carnosus]
MKLVSDSTYSKGINLKINGVLLSSSNYQKSFHGPVFIFINRNICDFRSQIFVNIYSLSHNKSWIAFVLHRRTNCSYSIILKNLKYHNARAMIIFSTKKDPFPLHNYSSIDFSTMLTIYANTFIDDLFSLGSNIENIRFNVTIEFIKITYNIFTKIYIIMGSCILGCIILTCIAHCFRQHRQIKREERIEKQLKNRVRKILKDDELVTIQNTQQLNEDEMCAICLNNIKSGDIIRKLKCNHLYHSDCVDPWLLNHQCCPLCNHNILSPIVSTISATIDNKIVITTKLCENNCIQNAISDGEETTQL